MGETFDILTHPLVMPVSVALVFGALAYAVSRWSPWACRVLALLGGALVLAASVALARGGELAFSRAWLALGRDVTLAVGLKTSTLGLAVLIAACAFALLISVYSFRAMAGTYWEGKFYAYLLWALGGAGIVALADNLLVLLVGWELVTLMLFLMANQGRAGAESAAAKAYGVLGFADACLLLAVALLAGMAGGSDNWALGAGRDLAETGATGYLVYVLILVAALAKAGAIPFHTWIPAMATKAPTPVMAYLPAALDKLLGIYLLAVLSLRMFRPSPAMQTVMMVIGAATILAAVLMAMMQHNLKRLLSFHAVSQVGYMVLGIGTGTTIGVIGGLFHMLNHAIYKSCLFLMSGSVSRAAGSDEIEHMGGLGRYLPVTFVSGVVAALAISGVPPLNGFISKWLVYQGALQVGSRGLAVALVVVAVFGSALTLASFVKVLHSAFLSPAPAGSLEGDRRPRESVLMAAPMLVLAGACVFFGLWPHTAIAGIFQPALAAVAGEAGRAVTGGQGLVAAEGMVWTQELGAWFPGPATWLILFGIFIGLGLVWLGTRRVKMRVVRPFLAGEVVGAGDDRFRVPGTHFYKTIGKLPIVGPLLFHGEAGAMDVYYWSGKHGHTLVEVLRRAHTGLVSLYVAWVLIGLTATLLYLLLACSP
jgi:formate hydrogenlyase subunit 3/multisubunit Na+/H+ antiporter MnhD subunit